jgi:glycosyltransferase involved in cell wall biosynthesis
MLLDHPFREAIKENLRALLARQQSALEMSECLKIDLHCHDHNSDVPDELLGRILGIPETWLPTEQLLKTLQANGVDVITVTNHNNARTCWELLEKGTDILTGGEFGCTLPELDVSVHVLAYGFTPEQEQELNRRRQHLYRFLEYTNENDLPTVLAHPFHFYDPKRRLTLTEFDRLGVLFERFEVVNGQRDSWQNVLTAAWLESLTAEKIDAIGRQTGISPWRYCKDPYKKVMCGGSDDHMGIFAGFTGSLLTIPGLQERLRTEKKSALALQALREGAVVPYGSYNESEKLIFALLDLFCQIAMNMKDPGLIRMLLHRGPGQYKLLALAVSNAILEIRRHRHTLKFLTTFHESLAGIRPGKMSSLLVSRSWKPMIQLIDKLAILRRTSSAAILDGMQTTLLPIFHTFNLLLAQRVQRNLQSLDGAQRRSRLGSRELVKKFELPSHLRALFGESEASEDGEMTRVNLGALVDGLSFPALASAVIAGAHFAAHRALFKDRAFLNRVADDLGRFQHPKRSLWLTDTLDDKNGVSRALRSILSEVQRRNLPIDFLVCSKDTPQEDHLLVLPPILEFAVPAYRSQVFRIPDLLEFQDIFRRGCYDRVICSTELIMGALAMLLKHAFSVPAYFYLHTDWLDFADKTLQLDMRSRDRIRRLLRAFYRSYDGLFVLNAEQRAWLSGPAMGIPRSRIFATTHWVESQFKPLTCEKSRVFPGIQEHNHVLLFSGRISEEKGVLEIPEIYRQVKDRFPNVRLAFAGEGPAETRLRSLLPDGVFLGWVDSHRLPAVYSSADLLILPSRFDTFGCVVLEAMSCGLPVVAYNTKGPRDLIQDRVSGFLVDKPTEFPECIVDFLMSGPLRKRMGHAAAARASNYRPEETLDRLMEDVGFNQPEVGLSLKKTAAAGELDPDIAHLYADGGASFLENLLELVREE